MAVKAPGARARQAGVVLAALLIGALAGCASPAPTVKRVVLIAPFEGNSREIGYDMLYPVRLALADAAAQDIVLVAVDAGESAEAAAQKAAALADDPSVLMALTAGATAANEQVFDALGDIPTVVIGQWNARPSAHVLVMASADLADQLTSNEMDVFAAALETGVTGGETFGLKAFALLASEPAGITVLTNAAPADAAFAQRLAASGLFVPEPGLLATAAYDSGTLAAEALAGADTRAEVLAALRETDRRGINGQLRFDSEGYWLDAPVYMLRYVDGVLRLADGVD